MRASTLSTAYFVANLQPRGSQWLLVSKGKPPRCSTASLPVTCSKSLGTMDTVRRRSANRFTILRKTSVAPSKTRR